MLCLGVVIGELRFRGWLLASGVLEGGYWCVMSGSSYWYVLEDGYRCVTS